MNFKYILFARILCDSKYDVRGLQFSIIFIAREEKICGEHWWRSIRSIVEYYTCYIYYTYLLKKYYGRKTCHIFWSIVKGHVFRYRLSFPSCKKNRTIDATQADWDIRAQHEKEEPIRACDRANTERVFASSVAHAAVYHRRGRGNGFEVYWGCAAAWEVRYCVSVLTSMTGLTLHSLNTQSAKKLFTCQLCSKVLCSKASLKRHVADKHAERQEEYRCVICERVYCSRNSLMTHIYTYHKSRPGDIDIKFFWRFR